MQYETKDLIVKKIISGINDSIEPQHEAAILLLINSFARQAKFITEIYTHKHAEGYKFYIFCFADYKFTAEFFGKSLIDVRGCNGGEINHILKFN